MNVQIKGNIAKKRLEKGLTQEQLLRRTEDITLRTLQRAEKEPLKVNLRTAKQIADALEDTIDNIFFK